MDDPAILQRRFLGYFLLVALTCVIYANTFEASWHFDDYNNIVFNSKLHLNDLKASSLIDTLYASPFVKDKLYRPIACLTFGLNWYAGQESVFGYHVVNLLIHCLSAILLIQTMLLLFRTPMLSEHYPSKEAPYCIALLAATLWAIHPIQTQAVTYIVQRMAALAGMFYIAGLFCFLKGRLQADSRRALIWFAGAGMAYLLALGSKENAVIFPLGVLLMEVALFRPRLFSSPRSRWVLATGISIVVLIGVVAALLISEETMNAFFHGYERRLFNHTERLMTQFRILVYYLYQIAYPNPASLNLSHDFTVSTGLFSPWTTLPAIVLIFGILWSSWFFLPRFPLVCLGGLFFLLHHSIESTLLPLELVYEHRNYIPSMFLFAGPAAGLFRLIGYYRERNPSLNRLAVVGSALLLCFIGLGTYGRNSDWRTEKSLWEDALQKAPGSGRAYHNLAWGYYDRIREIDTSIALYQQAIDKQIYRKGTAATSYLNIGNIYYHQGDYRAAIAQYLESLRINPDKISTHIRMIQSYMALSQWPQAEAAIESAISLGGHREDLYRLKARFLLTQNQPAAALEWFRKANRLGGAQIWQDLAGIGQSLRLLGHYERGDFFLRCAQEVAPQELFLLLSRLDLHLDAGQWKGATALADQFVRSVPAGTVATVWEQLRSDPSHYSLQYQRLRPLVEAALHRAMRQFENSPDLMASKRK